MEESATPAEVAITFASDAAFVVDSSVTATATVQDESGAPVAGTVVQWSATSGEVAPATDTTNSDGTAQTQWTLATDQVGPDAQGLSVSVQGQSEVATTTNVDVNPGPVARLLADPDSVALPVDSTTVLSIVRLEDAYGNEISDPSQYTFSWTPLDDNVEVSPRASGTEAEITGQSDGETHVAVSTGASPQATARGLQTSQGAAGDTVAVDVRQHELRGIWLTNTSGVMVSRTRIETAMEFLAEHNFNAVFPVVWNDATTLYPSTVMDTLLNQPIAPPYEGRDPLQEIIEEAHERDIAVIPWFEYGFSSSYSDNGGPIIDKYPSWAAKDESGDLLTKNGFDWMNPYKPAVQNFMKDLVLEVVRNYDVDGIQGDDRLPANPVEGGYSEYTKQRYRQDHNGQDPPSDPRDPGWVQWRANILSAFGQEVYNEVKAEDPDLMVSWAPSIWNFGYREYLQDWPTWVNQGTTDLIHPQVYRRDTVAYKSTLNTQAPDAAGWDASQVVGFYPGILLKVGTYRATTAEIKAMVRANRNRGYNGEVFFYYAGLRESDGAVADALKNSFYTDPAPLPFKRASAD